MIDHTMYVSSRDKGTQVYRCMDAKEFHEKQWTKEEPQGILVEHKSLESPPPSLSGEPLSPGSQEIICESQQEPHLSRSRKPDDLLQLVRKLSIRTQPRRATVEEPSTPDATESPPTIEPSRAENMTTANQYNMPLNSERRIPNASFARKYKIYEDTKAIPPYIREQAIAEAKVASKPRMNQASERPHSWANKGPLTPQLWYDSGLDYRWGKR